MQKYHFTINFREYDWFTESYGLERVLEINTDNRQYAIEWMRQDDDNRLLLNWIRRTNEKN